MRRSVALVAVFVAYLMVPGSLELTETLAHVTVHGDLAHGQADGHEQPTGNDEHGCSGGYHLCICHHATGFVVPLRVAIERPAELAASEMMSIGQLAPCPDLARIFRPPIA